MDQILTGIASGCIMIVVGLYLRNVWKAKATPNASTWLIWVVVSGMNAISYHVLTRSKVINSLYTFIVFFGLLGIFLIASLKGRFTKIGWIDIFCLILSLICGVVWKASGSAIAANLGLQAIFLVSFIPTATSLLYKGAKEELPPWGLAVIAYSMMIIAILLRKEWQWYELGFPIVNGIIGNGSIALIIIVQNHKRRHHATH